MTGAVHLTHLVLPDMVARGEGRLLFTSSVAARMAGPYESTYAASKAFLLSFAEALRIEVEDRGVTVTALMPGPTDTNFFSRAVDGGKGSCRCRIREEKAQAAVGSIRPDRAAAAVHGSMSRPDSDER